MPADVKAADSLFQKTRQTLECCFELREDGGSLYRRRLSKPSLPPNEQGLRQTRVENRVREMAGIWRDPNTKDVKCRISTAYEFTKSKEDAGDPPWSRLAHSSQKKLDADAK